MHACEYIYKVRHEDGPEEDVYQIDIGYLPEDGHPFYAPSVLPPPVGRFE